MSVEVPPAGVAAEMEQIFRPLDGRIRDRIAPATRPVVARSRGFGRRLLLFGAPALVLPTATALMVSKGRLGALPVREHTARPAPAQRAAAMPVHQADVSVEDDLQLARPITRQAIASHSPVTTATAVLVTPADAIPTDAGARSPRAERNALPGWSRPSRSAIIPTSRRVTTSAGGPGCTTDSSGDTCLYEDVLDADIRLRRAYRNADRAGVPSWRLAGIAERWRAARSDADVDPEGTIRRYDRLADTLDDLSDVEQ